MSPSSLWRGRPSSSHLLCFVRRPEEFSSQCGMFGECFPNRRRNGGIAAIVCCFVSHFLRSVQMCSFKKLAVVLLAIAAFVSLGNAWAQASLFPPDAGDLALGGTATMISHLPEAGADGGPERAIDGNRSGNGADNSITFTGETGFGQDLNPWWQVALPAAADIGKIIVFNRTDGDGGTYLNPFQVQVFNNTTSVWSSGTIAAFTPDISLGEYPVGGGSTGPIAAGQTFTIPGGVTGNIVKVTQVGAPSWLCLAEVEVYSVPEPGTLILGATGLIGLLAYAWRKRK